MLRLLADENVVMPLVLALRLQGFDVANADDLQLRQTDDEQILDAATKSLRIVLTNDAGFLAIVARKQAASEQFAPVLFWQQQSRSIQQLLDKIVPIANETYTAIQT